MAKRKKTDFVQFKVRFREALRARLEATAKAQERSLNNEIVDRLEQSFVRDRSREQHEEVIASLKDNQETLKRMVQTWATMYRRLKTGQEQPAGEEAELFTETPTGQQQSTNEEPELFTETPRRQGGEK